MGEFAALGAAVSFSAASTFFTLSGRVLGPSLVMRGSLPIGLVCLSMVYAALTHHLLPPDVEASRLMWLGLSGVTGYWLSAVAVVNAFVRIGPRLTLLIASLGPILSAVLAWMLLGERLGVGALAGIGLTVGGVSWVVSETGQNGQQISAQDYRLGALFALGAACLQAVSFVLSKKGLEGGYEPVAGNLIRLAAATVTIWLFALAQGQVRASFRAFHDHPRAFRHMSAAALVGPALGATLVMVALRYAEVGVASTITNLTPIFLIPVGYLVFQERITPRAVTGTLVAIIGTGVLFLA